MSKAIIQALNLIAHPSEELFDILSTTARMSLSSSVIALLLGTSLGLWLGLSRSKAKAPLIVINRTLMGMPPVVCGLIFYILFSGVGPFRGLHLMFTVPLMILAQVCLITPIVVSNIESSVSAIAAPVRETCIALGLSPAKRLLLSAAEARYQIFTAFLTAFSRAIAEVGAVSMVGGAIAWKTNVMTTAIMMYTNRGDFTLGVALGIILMLLSLIINVSVTLLQRRLSR